MYQLFNSFIIQNKENKGSWDFTGQWTIFGYISWTIKIRIRVRVRVKVRVKVKVRVNGQ